MNKYERIKTAVDNGIPDQVPYAFWTHLPGIDMNPEKLAEGKLQVEIEQKYNQETLSSA